VQLIQCHLVSHDGDDDDDDDDDAKVGEIGDIILGVRDNMKTSDSNTDLNNKF
jgi:hypothetical protein